MPANVLVNTPTIPGRETWLGQAVASVDNQTRPAIDHLVGDDVHGVGAWRMHNYLVERQLAAHGGPDPDLWILNLDDDNALSALYLEELLAIADNADDDIAVISAMPYVVDDSSRPYKRARAEAALLNPLAAPLEQANSIDLCALIRSTAWSEANGLDPNVAFADWDLWLRLVHSGHRIHCHPHRLWYYRVHDDQLGDRNNDDVETGILPATSYHPVPS
jgi:hypothetical protein